VRTEQGSRQPRPVRAVTPSSDVEAPAGAPIAVDRADLPAGTPTVARHGRYPALDGLRALAVLAVMATHVGFQTGLYERGVVGAVLARGDIGVTVFFLLSGFLLWTPFVRAHLQRTAGPRARSFLRNRALRILPAYWVLLSVVLPTLDQHVINPFRVFLQVVLGQVYVRDQLLGGLTQTWSLAVEATFYLALPLLAWATAPRRPRSQGEQLRAEARLLAAMVVAAVAWTVVARQGGIDVHVGPLWLPQYLDWFALGMGFAVLRCWHDQTRSLRVLDQLGDAGLTCWCVAALLFWLTTTPLAGPRSLDLPTTWQALTKHVLYGLASAALLLPAVFGTDARSPVRRLLTCRPARHLGRISYGVFLWHLLALDLVFRLTPLTPFQGHALVVAALLLPLSLGLAELSLRVVEQPALRLKRPTLPTR
jgi:peptidoglycan/LPS O-acetylase OafA/YrhL